MFRICLSLLMLAVPSSGLGQAAATQPQSTTPQRLDVRTSVIAISASTRGRLLFWIVVPGGPREGRAFTIAPDMESPWGGSAVLGLLMTSYQTTRIVRIFYVPSTEPNGVGLIVRVDAGDNRYPPANPPAGPRP